MPCSGIGAGRLRKLFNGIGIGVVGLVCAGAAALAYELRASHAPGSLAAVTLVILALSLLATAALAGLALNRHRAFARMRDAERSFRDLYDSISEGVFRSTLDGRMISANPALVRFNGYETEAELIEAVADIGAEWYVDPNRRDEIHRMLLEAGHLRNIVSEVYRHRTRERIWMQESVRLVRDGRTGEPLYYDGTLRDVTETMRRLELQERYDKIASIVSGCLFQFRMTPDGAMSMPYASVGLMSIFGVQPESVRDDAAAVFARIAPEDTPRLNAAIQHSLATMSDFRCEYRVRSPDGAEKWIFANSTPERLADGSTLWHGFLTDVSERKRAEARIYELAYFDSLTGLPNRTMLRERLSMHAAVDAKGPWSALLFIDLDQFKTINDSKGHQVGDMLLCQVADRLRSQVRAEDLVARLGGDEFVIVWTGFSSDRTEAARQAQARGEALLAAIDQPFVIQGTPFPTTASIGATLFKAGDRAVDDLLKCADLAMYDSKAAGRNTFRFFAPVMLRGIEDRLALTSDLRAALAGDGLTLAFQPQVDRSGVCFGAEALLRWEHPGRGPISPVEVIRLAHREGLLNQVEEWVLRSALATLRSWQADLRTSSLQLAVNISAHQLSRPGFVQTFQQMLAETGADPRGLNIELTEHVMLEHMGDASAVMHQLKAFGVSFALDDFGTGYSSLSSLKRLPFDTLKIDRSFVRDMELHPSDREIVQTIVSIAGSLKLAVIAEGVETEMQALLLRQMGCNAYQGYLYGRPVPLAAFLSEFGEHASSGERDRRPDERGVG